MSSKFSSLNEKLYKSVEISSIGTAGTVRLLKGKAAKFLNFIGRSLAYTSTRSYGCFILSFGLMSLFLHLGEYYFADEPQIAFSLIVGASCALLALPLLIFNKPMCIALQDFALTDIVFFEFFLIKRMQRNVNHVSIPPLVALFLGFIPAVAGFFVPVKWVVISMVLIVGITVSFTTPEFPMILTLLALPYLSVIPMSKIILLAMSIVTFLSFALKVILGKRVYNLDIYDVIIGLIILFVLISGIAGYGENSLKNSIVFIALLLGYFPASNLIVNRRLADCAMNAVVVSAIPITVISVIEFIVELPITSCKAPEYSTPGTSALFSTGSSLAAFMIVAAILTFAFAIEKKKRSKKIFYYSLFIFETFVIGLLLQFGALVAVVFSAAVYLILTSRKIPHDLIAVLIFGAHLLLFIPMEKLNMLSKALGLSPTLPAVISGYKRAFKVFSENIWIGIGIGDDSYKTATGINSGGIFNTLLGIGVEVGVFALILFVFIIFIRLRHLSYYRHYTNNSFVNTAVKMTALSTLSLLACGAFANIFEDVTIFYLFWSVFGICSSSLRTAKKEWDDRLGYYGDSRSAELSVVDVSIRK